jgi:hypothetical protein
VNNEANRLFIVILAAAVIVVMAVIIFLTWSADTDVIDRIGDFAEYLEAHNDDAGKLIVTLAALVVVVLSFLLIILELAPEEEERELRVKQAGAVTIVPAGALRQRLEEALRTRPGITAARARVSTGDKGIATNLNLTVAPSSNIAAVSQDAVRVAVDTIQNDLGLPVHGVPTVRVTFADGKDRPAPVASSVIKPPETPATAGTDEPRPWSMQDRTSTANPTSEPAALPDEPYAAQVSGPPMPVDESPEDQPGAAIPDAPAPESPERPFEATPQEPPSETVSEDTAGRPSPGEDSPPEPPNQELSRDPWRQS